MRVAEIMTRDVRVVRPDDSLRKTAEIMASVDTGAVPVCNGQELVGMVTDRDIVVRGVAQDCAMKDIKLADVMSASVHCVKEGDDINSVLDEMADKQIRRCPVVDDRQQLIGIVSLGDIAVKDPDDDVGASLGDISMPAEPDRSVAASCPVDSGQSQRQG